MSVWKKSPVLACTIEKYRYKAICIHCTVLHVYIQYNLRNIENGQCVYIA